jgi:hypothetical protein
VTAPSTDAEVAAAKAALQKRFTQMLLSSKDKTEKIEKLLAKSPEYQQLLMASAADVMKQATAFGHGNTASSRSVAQKTAEQHAEKEMAKLRAGISGELKTRIAEDYGQIDALAKGLTAATAKADNASAAIKQLSQKEFLTNPASKDLISIKWDKAAMDRLAANVHARHQDLDKLRTKLDALMSVDDESKLREGVRSCEKELFEHKTAIGEATKSVSKALAKLDFKIDEKALRAYIRQVAAKDDIKDLEKGFEFVHTAIDMTGAVFSATEATKTLTRAANLITDIAKEYGKEQIVKKRGKEYGAEHTRGELFAEHTENPLLIAQQLFEDQEKALDFFLQGLGTTLSGALIAAHGAGEIVMKVWDPVTKAIQDVLSTRLKARLKLAQDALAAQNVEYAKQLQTDRDKSLEEEITKAIKEKVEEFGKKLGEEALKAISGGGDGGGDGGEEGGIAGIFTEIAKDPAKLVSTVLGWIVKPIMKKVWEIFPPKPAETITGDDLTNMHNVIHIAQLPIDMAVQGRVPRVAQPFTSLDTRPSDVDQSAWDQFDEVNAGRTAFPDDPAKRTYYVSLTVPEFDNVKVWGHFDPRTKRFVPDQPDPTAFDDWSDRTIAGTGYSDGALTTGGPAVVGKWAIVRVGSINYVTLTESGGRRHWGGYADNTRGPRGTSSQLGSIIETLQSIDRQVMGGFPVGQ